MNPGQNGNDPGLSEGPARADAKAEHPPGVEPKKSLASRSWPLIRKVLRIVVGVFLLLLGLAALFTPFTPGSWLVLVGLEFLGLRVLLRDWLCAKARAKPQSRLRRVACRIFSVGHRNATKPRWWRHPFRKTPGVGCDEPCHRQGKDK
ncbi:MAG: hypothetical protein M1376_06490 [Planctomycetes bacterium]|nr:hypothetical protein [Planctomycetota bacterium]